VISGGGAWFLSGVCDGCKKHTGEKLKKFWGFYGPLFFTSHSRRKTPPEEIQAGDFSYFWSFKSTSKICS